MSRTARLLARLEDASDWLSPIVVKEVRQIVRGREFMYAFGASLVAGLAVAFFGAADALGGAGTSGRWTFGALMGCLAVFGFVVVPMGAFSALRVERLEQTLELITLTAMSSRRVVIGKLLAQGVKLGTLFAGMAPFIAMSYLLGGIDFPSILIALAVLFMWSLWTCAAGLFLSSLLKSRAMVGLAFGAAIVVLFLVMGLGRMLVFIATSGPIPGSPLFGSGIFGSDPWWGLAILTSACLVTMMNLVLLAENRLAMPTENSVAPLRVGFFVQLLVLAGWCLSFAGAVSLARDQALEVLGVVGGLHLALVAMFAVTDDLAPLRRGLATAVAAPLRRAVAALLQPGGGHGAIYVLAQMCVLLAAAAFFAPTGSEFRWFLAICSYICLFTGVPTVIFRAWRPARAASLRLRVGTILLLPLVLSLLLPDVIYYVVWQPEVLSLEFGARHLINPFRTLANWRLVEGNGWVFAPLTLGAVGLIAYAALVRIGAMVERNAQPAGVAGTTAGSEAGRASALY